MTTSPVAQTRARGIRAMLVAAAALFIVAAPIAVAAPAQADETIGISARPADADGNADIRNFFSYRSDPGQQVGDNFLVANTGTAEQAFTVVGTDAFNDDKGAFALLPTADQPTMIGAWIKFENGANRIEFTLAPGETRVLPFTLDLPAEATPGDHVGGLVASVLQPGEQVNVDRRVATPIYTRVSGQLQPRLNIANIDASYGGDWWNPFAGTVTVRYTVDNPGNIALAANLDTGVNTWFGIPLAAESGGMLEEVLPGNSAAYELEVDGIGQWLYLNPFLELTPFVDNPDPAMQLPAGPTTRDTFLLAVPWVLVIALAIAALIFLGLRWRKKRDEARAKAWMEHTKAEARAAVEMEAAEKKEAAEKEAELVGTSGGGGSRDG